MLRATRIVPNRRFLFVEFDDGNQVMLDWSISKKVLQATPSERADVTIANDGLCLRWPQLDEDVPVRDLAWRQ